MKTTRDRLATKTSQVWPVSLLIPEHGRLNSCSNFYQDGEKGGVDHDRVGMASQFQSYILGSRFLIDNAGGGTKEALKAYLKPSG